MILTFRGYVAVKISPLNQVFYFLPELDAIFHSMPVVPMELTIPGIISFGRVLLFCDQDILETFKSSSK